MSRLERLAKTKPSFIAFLGEVRQWRKWYLVTDQEKRMTIAGLQKFYDEIRGNVC